MSQHTWSPAINASEHVHHTNTSPMYPLLYQCLQYNRLPPGRKSSSAPHWYKNASRPSVPRGELSDAPSFYSNIYVPTYLRNHFPTKMLENRGFTPKNAYRPRAPRGALSDGPFFYSNTYVLTSRTTPQQMCYS